MLKAVIAPLNRRLTVSLCSLIVQVVCVVSGSNISADELAALVSENESPLSPAPHK